METLLALRGASAWIACGGVLALVAGIVSIVGAIKNNNEQQDLILGERKTFCQLTVYGGPRDWYLSTHHRGHGNVYDLQILLREVREDGTPVYNRERHILGTLTADTWPWVLQPFGSTGPVVNTTARYFEAQINQRNGTSLQDIVIYPKKDGAVELGFLRLEFNKESYKPQFHLLPAGAKGIDVSATEIERIFDLRRKRGPQR